MQNLKKVQNCSDALKSQLPQGFFPHVGIVLGTGLGNFATLMQNSVSVPYASLPDFPQSTVTSHAGKFVAGALSGVPVIVQQGRCHLYEGKTPGDVCMGVRVMAELGITSVILTNAAGALNPQYTPGTLMVIDDHINMTGKSPLTGRNQDEWGPRFPDMSRVYDAKHIYDLEETALKLGIRLEKGVYIGINGPQLETRAETRMYRTMGADAIGMSTVMEAIAASHKGLRVLGISCLTNKNLPDCMEEATIEDIIATACLAEDALATLLEGVLPLMRSVETDRQLCALNPS